MNAPTTSGLATSLTLARELARECDERARASAIAACIARYGRGAYNASQFVNAMIDDPHAADWHATADAWRETARAIERAIGEHAENMPPF